MLQKVIPCKVVGPDSVPGWVLKDGVEQLAEVFTGIFNLSLSLATVLKKVLKKTNTSNLRTTIVQLPSHRQQ